MSGTTGTLLFYIDTTILIDALEHETEEAQWLRNGLLSPGGSEPHRLVTSALTITECLVVPLRRRDWDHAHLLQAWLTAGEVLRVVSVTDGMFYMAAALRSRYEHLKTPDAIHVAAAIAERCDYIVTGDKRLRGSYDATHERPVFADEPTTSASAKPVEVLNTRTGRAAIDALLARP
jgi:predicted nucleic acid-binding protein